MASIQDCFLAEYEDSLRNQTSFQTHLETRFYWKHYFIPYDFHQHLLQFEFHFTQDYFLDLRVNLQCHHTMNQIHYWHQSCQFQEQTDCFRRLNEG